MVDEIGVRLTLRESKSLHCDTAQKNRKSASIRGPVYHIAAAKPSLGKELHASKPKPATTSKGPNLSLKVFAYPPPKKNKMQLQPLSSRPPAGADEHFPNSRPPEPGCHKGSTSSCAISNPPGPQKTAPWPKTACFWLQPAPQQKGQKQPRRRPQAVPTKRKLLGCPGLQALRTKVDHL